MQPLNDSTSALLRALREKLPGGFVLEEIRSRGWSSATFSGARHRLALRLAGDQNEAADALIARLDPARFALRGHLVASIGLVSDDRADGEIRLGLEALTVEEG